MTEKVIGTVTENAGAIASTVTKSGMGTRGLVIGVSFAVATGIGIGAKCLIGMLKDRKKHDSQESINIEENVTDIAEAVKNVAEDNDN